ncbi:MAG: hypothetical protein ACLU4J_18530 [Butyricimonas paravirosa]
MTPEVVCIGRYRLISDPIEVSPESMAPSMKWSKCSTENGLPLGEDQPRAETSWYDPRERSEVFRVVALNEDILVLHTKRQPRFYASIGADHVIGGLG